MDAADPQPLLDPALRGATTLRRLAWLWSAAARGLRAPAKATAACALLPAVRAAGRVGLALDPLLFPALRRARLGPPVVIVGNPRSGTTFLQRFLVEQGVGCGREVWQMVYPSLTQQAVLRPFLSALEAVAPTRWHNTAAHKTGLTYVETDDASSLFRFNDGFFLYAFFLGHHAADLRPAFEPAHRDTRARDLDWLEQLWLRSQVAHGAERVVAKVFSLGASAPAFQSRFPDARMLYMARDPLSTIPSGLSLVTGVLDAAFGFWSLPEGHQRRYLDRLYAGLVMLLDRFTDDWRAGRIDRSRVLRVPFDRLMQDFDGLMGELLDFVGHPVDGALADALTAQAARQRAYRSPHRYDLARFGLTAERVRADTARFAETFLG